MSIEIVAGSIVFESFGKVRISDDGLLSVFDLIQVCAESQDRKYPHYTWSRITERFPEVTAKIKNIKFKGRGQKETPVCTKETALEILGLLPGATGKAYRQLAAKLVLAYLENPEQLAKAAIARVEEPEQLKEIADTARAKYLSKGYHPHMDNISSRLDFPDDRISFMRINTATTQAVTGKEPKQIQAERYSGKAKKPPSARKLMNEDELKWAESCHQVQSGTLTARDIQGSEKVVETCIEAAAEFQAMLIKLGVLR